MTSIFSRPPSPPPRAPSPDHSTGLKPLPIRRSSTRPHTATGANPSDLHNLQLQRIPVLRTSHSDIGWNSQLLSQRPPQRRPSKGMLKFSTPPSSTLSISASSDSLDSLRTLGRPKSFQHAMPYRSLPPSPCLISNPPPPVLSIPTFVLTDTDTETDTDTDKSETCLSSSPLSDSREKRQKRRRSRAITEAKTLKSRIFAFCTPNRSTAVCTA
ncbi:hypothetical protein D9757_015282 [Collybiopsis confluens]|nr:hypothetical protein D9757_015282 [Collybiopsis confluens]